MKHLFLGADASKGYCDFIVLDESIGVVEPHFQLDDLYEGHLVLKQVINKLFEAYHDRTLFIGIESTGGYENNWFSLFWELKDTHDIQLIRLNPKYIYHQKKASSTKITTDKTSAIAIAEYLKLHKDKLRFNQDQKYSDLRRLWTYLNLTKKQLSQCRNQLEKLIYTSNPQLLTYCKNNKPAWLYCVLRKYPTAQKLSNAKTSSLIKIPYVTEKLAIELIRKAKYSVASFISNVSQKLILRLIDEILILTKTIKETEQDICEMCDIAEVQLLKTFIGISDNSACGLMLIIERIQRFQSAKALSSFFGVHPAFKESGDGISCTKMSKEGSAEGRRILFNIVKSAIVHNDWIKTLYEEYQQKGKSKLSSMGILMHKVLRIVYGMLNNKTQYTPLFDQKNRQKFNNSENKKEIQNDVKSRRFQPKSYEAPISKRQYKKRKEQAVSPNDCSVIKCGITTPAPKNNIIPKQIKCK